MCAASASFSTAIAGDGMSGLPKPRSITSTPARRASTFRLLMIVKTYGGRFEIRRNSMRPERTAGVCSDFGKNAPMAKRPGRAASTS